MVGLSSKRWGGTYFVHGEAVPKDEVNTALNEAIFEVMATIMVIQSILIPKNCTVVESCHVRSDPKCHSLHPYSSWWWSWS